MTRVWFWILLAGVASAAEPLPLAKSYWQDPSFAKSFHGSYRIEARIEPTVTTEERGVLVEIQKLMAAGERESAIEKIRASELLDESAALQFNLGNLLFEQGELEKAEAAFEKAIEMYPSFRRAHRNLGMVMVRRDALERALEHLLEAMRLGDADGTTYGLVGYCRLQRGEWASALQAYRMAQVSQPNSIQWKAGVAQCLQHLDAKPEAVALLDEVIRELPEESSYAVLQASLLMELDRHTDATKALELPRRLGRLNSDGLILLASLQMQSGLVEGARQRVAEAYAQDEPPTEDRVLELAARAVNGEAWDLANDLIEKAMSATDQPSRPLRRAAARLAIESGKAPEEGAGMLDELIAEDPTDGKSLLALGRYLVANEKVERARLMLERATATPESAAEAWLDLARLHVAAERYSMALDAVNHTLELRSSDSLVAYRDALKQLIDAAR